MKYLDYNQNHILTDLNEETTPVSDKLADRNTHFLRLNAEQEQYHTDHPGATAHDLWHCTNHAITTEGYHLSPAELREREYRNRLSRSKIDAYVTYLAEGNTEAANAIATEIAKLKSDIRKQYPDPTDP